jgi:hypothetical protein
MLQVFEESKACVRICSGGCMSQNIMVLIPGPKLM